MSVDPRLGPNETRAAVEIQRISRSEDSRFPVGLESFISPPCPACFAHLSFFVFSR